MRKAMLVGSWIGRPTYVRRNGAGVIHKPFGLALAWHLHWENNSCQGDICLAMNTLNLSSTVLSEVAITELVSALVDRLSLRDLQLFILSLIVSHLPAMIGPHTS